MEIDAGFLNNPKEAERIKLLKEGKCYKCLKTGHIKRNCPEWQKKKPNDKPPPYKPKGRTATLSPVPEDKEKEPDDLKDLARRMSTLDSQGKEALFNLMMEEPDF